MGDPAQRAWEIRIQRRMIASEGDEAVSTKRVMVAVDVAREDEAPKLDTSLASHVDASSQVRGSRLRREQWVTVYGMPKRVACDLLYRGRSLDHVQDISAVPEWIARQVGARISGVPVAIHMALASVRELGMGMARGIALTGIQEQVTNDCPGGGHFVSFQDLDDQTHRSADVRVGSSESLR
jgi:hypothetical protein